MKFARPKTQILSATDGGATYKKEIYLAPTSLRGVTDEGHPSYDPSATYNAGDYVVVSDLKTIYRCTADGVSGVFPPSDPSTWVDYGYVNGARMLSTDEQIGSQTEGEDVAMEMPFDRCDTVAFVNTQFTQLAIEQLDENGDVVRRQDVSGRDIGALSFAEYFYDEIREKSRVIVTDLEWLPTSTLRLTFDGDVKIGSLVVGLLEPLGCTLYGAAMRFDDRSKIATDEFTGTRRVIRYGHVRVLRARVAFDAPDFDLVAQKIRAIVGKNVLFVPDESDRYGEMTNIAYIEEFEMPVDNSGIFEGETTLIGVT